MYHDKQKPCISAHSFLTSAQLLTNPPLECEPVSESKDMAELGEMLIHPPKKELCETSDYAGDVKDFRR
jgi:hypothetical protein